MTEFADKERAAAQIYRDALAEIDSETVCVGMGGDNYCYPNWHRQSVFHRTAKKRGAKSILWGCSIQPEQINGHMKRILSEHDHIYAREGLTASALRRQGIKQVTQIKDPAFSLQPEPVPLPTQFGKHTAALNLSPLALRRSEQLLHYFAETVHWLLTHMDALLMVPHVTMPMDNDRQALESLEQLLSPAERSRICWAGDDLNAAQRKYLISCCDLLICCRTHASIAGYSTGVPTIVVGYSVKSEGIGMDIGMKHWTVPIENSNSLMNLAEEMWKKRQSIQKLLKL